MKNLGNLNWTLIIKKYKLVYVPIPKNASTKIRTILILINRGYEDTQLYDFIINSPSPYYHWEFGITDNYRMKRSELSRLLSNPNFFKFAFVRNPYDRLVSMYNYRIREPHLQINLMLQDYSIHLQKYSIRFVKKIKAEYLWDTQEIIKFLVDRIDNQIYPFFLRNIGFCRYARTTKKYPLNRSSEYNYEYFKEIMRENLEESYGKELQDSLYEQYSIRMKKLFGYPELETIDIDKHPVSFGEFVDFVCKQNIKRMNVHWRPQTSLLNFNSIKYDFIGKIENFIQDLQYVLDTVKAPEYLYKYIEKEVNQSKKGDSLWTDSLAEKVYQKYKEDFQNFGYEKMSYEDR